MEDQMGADTELIKQTYEAFSCGDIPAVLDNLAEDVQWSTPATLPQGGQFQGKSGAMQFFQAVGAARDTLGLDVENVSEAGEDLVVRHRPRQWNAARRRTERLRRRARLHHS
jgi:uncharacterized protein